MSEPPIAPSDRSLWATLHGGVLERVDEDREGEVRLVIDVPHVRHHAGLPESARFVVRLCGQPFLSALHWRPSETPRPRTSEKAESDSPSPSRSPSRRLRGKGLPQKNRDGRPAPASSG